MSILNKLFKYKKLLNFYPPFLGAGIRLVDHDEVGNWYLVEMKLKWYNRNAVGTHYGGSLYSMCDPFYVFAAYSYFGDDYIIWDKSASISFLKPGTDAVEARFEIPIQRLEEMKHLVDSGSQRTFHFSTHIINKKTREIVAEVQKEIYIRAKLTK